MSNHAHELLIQDQARLRTLARGLLRDTHAADDVVQDAWLVATGTDAAARSPNPWLRAVTRNLALRRLRAEERRRNREATVARSEREPSTADRVAALELRRRLLDAIEALGEPYRGTIVARYFEDQMPAAIAEAQGVPVKTVKTRLSRGLAQLRKQLDATHGSRRAWAMPLGLLTHTGREVATASTTAAVLTGGTAMAGKVWVTVGAIVLIVLSVWLVDDPEPEATEVPVAKQPAAEPPAMPGRPELLADGVAPRPAAVGASPEPSKANSAPAPASENEAPAAVPVGITYRDVAGRIVDADGVGVAGIKVITRQRASPDEPISDAHGAFRVEKAGIVDGVIEVQFGDVPPAYLRPKPIRKVDDGSPIRLTLKPALSVTGRLLAPQGVKYTSLGIYSQAAEMRGRTFSRRGTLEPDGSFVIGGLEPGSKIRVFAKDHWMQRPGTLASSFVDNVPAGATGVEVVMSTGQVLEGTAFHADGSPYAEKPVMLVSVDTPYLGGSSRRSGKDGSFRFTGLQPGVYYAGLGGGNGIHLLGARTRIEVPTPPIELRMGPKPRLRIRLRPPAGHEDLDLSKFRVKPESRGGAWHLDGYTFETNEDGVADVAAIAGATYDVFIGREGSSLYARATSLRAGADTVEVTLQNGKRIEGRVFDVTGRPLKGGGHVDLVVGRFAPSTEIRPDGTFTFTGVPPGRHTLRAHPQHSSLALWEHDIEAGRTDVVLRLQPTDGGR